jgi:hypothetical protein
MTCMLPHSYHAGTTFLFDELVGRQPDIRGQITRKSEEKVGENLAFAM